LEGNSCLLSGGAPDSPVHHRTTTVHVRCAISFHSWRSRPLQSSGSWRTGQSSAPYRPLERATRRPRIWRPTVALAAVGSPDSPVNYSRTPPMNSREWLVRQSWSGAPDTVRCPTGQSGVPDRAESWLLQPIPFLFFFSLILALRQTSLVYKNQCTKSRIIPSCRFALHSSFGI
jgi:hypothetical protein